MLVKHIYLADELTMVHVTKIVNFRNHSTKLPDLYAFDIIRQITCYCGKACIGRTNFCLDQRKVEHIPKRLVKQVTYSSPGRENKQGT